MWHPVQTTLGWFLAAAMLATLSVICLLQWKGRHDNEQVLAASLNRGLQRLDQRIDLVNSRWQSLLGTMQKKDDARIPDRLPSSADAAETDEPPAKALETPEAVGQEDPETAGRPPIPPGLSPRQVVRLKLEDILSDPALNPQRKNPTVQEAAALRAELVRARSAIETIDAELQVDLLEGAEMLKAQGDFIEYGPDDKRQTFPGVLTTAEMMPGGALRMFYFYPEMFPEIYEKKKRKSEIARASTRKLLAMLSDLKGSSRE